MPEESKQPDDDLDRIKTLAIRYRAERNADRGRATTFEEALAHTSAENLKLREAIRKLQTRDLNLQPIVEDPVGQNDHDFHKPLSCHSTRSGILQQLAASVIP
jgi:hypothetical protein